MYSKIERTCPVAADVVIVVRPSRAAIRPYKSTTQLSATIAHLGESTAFCACRLSPSDPGTSTVRGISCGLGWLAAVTLRGIEQPTRSQGDQAEQESGLQPENDQQRTLHFVVHLDERQVEIVALLCLFDADRVIQHFAELLFAEHAVE